MPSHGKIGSYWPYSFDSALDSVGDTSEVGCHRLKYENRNVVLIGYNITPSARLLHGHLGWVSMGISYGAEHDKVKPITFCLYLESSPSVLKLF